MAARETAKDKALRLIAEQRVRFISVSPAGCVAQVAGEHGDYITDFDGRRWGCSCEHGANSRGHCSHSLAAQTIYRSVVPALR